MKKLGFGTLAVALALGMAFVGCAREDALQGTWEGQGLVVEFEGNDFTVRMGGAVFASGTYSARGGEITLTVEGEDDITGTYSVDGDTLNLDVAFPGFSNLTLTRVEE